MTNDVPFKFLCSYWFIESRAMIDITSTKESVPLDGSSVLQLLYLF